jgi:outer membrane protein
MSKKFLVFFFGLVFGFQVTAQRFGIVDSEYVLTQIPEYALAQQQLDQLSRTWEGEIESLLSEADALRKGYEAEKVLLTEEKQAERLAGIKAKEDEAKEKQQLYFGVKGKIYVKRLELIKPIQDKIYNAVQDVARKRNLDVVFDKGSELITLYVNEKVDISDEVIENLES